MGDVGGPRHYHGAGLGAVGAWTCPTCGTQHVTPFEAGCSVCLAEDARRMTAVAGAVQGIPALAAQVLQPDLAESVHAADFVRGIVFSDATRQSLAAALGHYVEHGAPDDTLLSKAVLIGWARELAGLEGAQ